MGMTIIEKILADHSVYDVVRPGEIVDVHIDYRVMRDVGGSNLLRNFEENHLVINDPQKSFFTFDCSPANPDQQYVENQFKFRNFARDRGIKIFDTHTGIGSHLMIDQGHAIPGITMISSDAHINILGAIGALGQGLNDKDIVSSFNKGKIWYRVPKSIKINLTGTLPERTTAKDIALNLISIFGSNKLLGYAVELTGPVIDALSLDSRITLASMASEMGAVTFLMIPNQEVIDYCQYKSNQNFNIIRPDDDAEYEDEFNVDASKFQRMIALPGDIMEILPVEKIENTGIDSAFIGSCTNGRIEDLRIAAGILKNRKVAPGVVLRIVPATDEIWTQSLQEGLIDIFKESGAMVSDAGCGGCASGRVGQSLVGNVTISSGNRNFPGRVSRGDVYLASPAIVAASAIAGFIVTPENIPEKTTQLFSFNQKPKTAEEIANQPIASSKPTVLEGHVWNIPFDDIDTDMIYHNRYTHLTDLSELGNYTFTHLEGFEDFATKANPGDIVVVGQNFGLGNSSKHAVDCFKSLGIQAIIAKSFAVIYERNAINAGLPVIVCPNLDELELQNDDTLVIDLKTGEIKNTRNEKSVLGEKFSGMQMEIYQQGGMYYV